MADEKTRKSSFFSSNIFEGLLFILLGVAILIWPNHALKTLCVIAGIAVGLMGVLKSIFFIKTPKEERKIGMIIVGVIQLAFGIALIAASEFFINLFFVITGLMLVYGAFLMFFRAVQLRHVKGVMFALSIIFGIIYTILAVIIFMNPEGFAQFITRIQGVALIFEGLGLIIVLRNLKISFEMTKE